MANNEIKIHEHADAARIAAERGEELSQLSRSSMSEFFDGKKLDEAVESSRGKVAQALQEGDGQMIFAEVDGELAAMTGYLKRGTWKGRQVYESKNTVTLPKYRGMSNVTLPLLLAMAKQVEELDKDALICVYSSDEEHIIPLCEKMILAGRGEEISVDEYHAMMKEAEQMDIPLDEYKGYIEEHPVIKKSRLFMMDLRGKN